MPTPWDWNKSTHEDFSWFLRPLITRMRVTVWTALDLMHSHGVGIESAANLWLDDFGAVQADHWTSRDGHPERRST